MRQMENKRPLGGAVRITFVLAAFALMGTGNAGEPPFDLAQYRGKVVVVDFWASWCVPCRRSFPWLNRMYREYGADGLEIIGVNLDTNADDAKAFLRDFSPDFRIVYDPAGTLAGQYGVEAMPMSFVVNRQGAVVANHPGFRVKKQDEYEQVIRDALGDSELD